MDSIIQAIDEEIQRLQKARNLLAQNKGSSVLISAGKQPQKRHTMSAAGRARIAAAQKKRWAAKKKASSKVPF